MKFQILMSTMNKKQFEIENIIKQNRIMSSVLVINQSEVDMIQYQTSNLQVFSYCEYGLSRSRNRALELSNAEICLIADDDIEYVHNLEEIITDTFDKHPDYDIIAFYVDKNNLGDVSGKTHQINFYQSLSLMSVQIAYRRQSVVNANIRFDERFGTGSKKYTNGEENIFLSDSLRNGLKILYVPKRIAILKESESSWFHGFDELFFKSKGALFYRLNPSLSFFLILSFLILKYPLYKGDISIRTALKSMLIGKREIKMEGI